MSFFVQSVFFLAGVGVALGQDLTCFKTLPVPKFPRLAHQARIDGEVRVKFIPRKDGRPHEIAYSASSFPSPSQARVFLVDDLPRAVEKAEISRRCAGRVIEIRFAFRIDRDAQPSDARVGNVLISGEENRITVMVAPPIMQVD